VAASVNPWPGATVKAIYSQAFRAPSWNETAYRGETQVGSDDLQPETVRNLEALFEQRLGAHRVFVGAFGTRWKELVGLQALTAAEIVEARSRGELPIEAQRASQFRNLSSIEELGFNAGFEGVVAGDLGYGGSVTAAMARLESDAGPEPLPVAPAIFGNMHLIYDLGGQLPSLGLATHFLGRRPSVTSRRSPSETPYAPALAEIRATVSGPTVVVPDLTYRVSANFVTAERGPYLVGPGEHFEDVEVPPEQNPIDRFRVTVGLSYLFGKQ
jgi:outer membrane cobalamin receptor